MRDRVLNPSLAISRSPLRKIREFDIFLSQSHPCLMRLTHASPIERWRPVEWAMLLPHTPPGGHPTKIGYNTFAMWGLCFIVVGVCYYLEQKEARQTRKLQRLPSDVDRVLPSGAMLMSAPPACPLNIFARYSRRTPDRRRGRIYSLWRAGWTMIAVKDCRCAVLAQSNLQEPHSLAQRCKTAASCPSWPAPVSCPRS